MIEKGKTHIEILKFYSVLHDLKPTQHLKIEFTNVSATLKQNYLNQQLTEQFKFLYGRTWQRGQ